MRRRNRTADIESFKAGWQGEHGEGKEVLRLLGLPTDTVPFNVRQFLKRRRLSFVMPNGGRVTVTLKKNGERFDFLCLFCGQKRVIKLYREWTTENQETIKNFEAYAIGECTRKIITGDRII